MSILVTFLARHGIVFAADRNITSTFQVVNSIGQVQPRLVGHSRRPKVLKWPNRDTIVGYVGQASIGERPTDLWLYDFIGRNLEFGELQPVAERLAEDLEQAFADAEPGQRGTIVHLAQFDRREDDWMPVVSYVRDIQVALGGKAFEHLSRFEARDELPLYLKGSTGAEVRAELGDQGWHGFRQGYDLPRFNELDRKLWEFRSTELEPAQSLADWENHARLSVLGYAAYFGAYWPPDQQLVGGGVDVVSVPWPDTSGVYLAPGAA
jgi:hypothetical protein